MRTTIAFFAGHWVNIVSRLLHRGAGITWAGEIALRVDPRFVSAVSKKITHRILVAGTNGKTTTSSMIAHILTDVQLPVIQNATGANLLNGIAGTLISHRDKIRTGVFGIFESDEAAFPAIVQNVKPTVVVLLNLFRDQLDRYGEVDVIADKWKKALSYLPKSAILIANADDPLIVSIAEKWHGTVQYFGITDEKKEGTLEHAADSIYCFSCGHKLSYNFITLSHLGDWYCPSCRVKRPEFSSFTIQSALSGVAHIYNAQAAILTVKQFKIPSTKAKQVLTTFKPVFGRQEELVIDGKKVIILLSKNPTGFNENIRTVLSRKDAGCLLFVLNDRIPDGTDVSWIWDVDFETLASSDLVVCSGDRAFDMGLRIKYIIKTLKHESIKTITEENLEVAIEAALKNIQKGKTLYIFPTYSAMLDIRKLLTGNKIL